MKYKDFFILLEADDSKLSGIDKVKKCAQCGKEFDLPGKFCKDSCYTDWVHDPKGKEYKDLDESDSDGPIVIDTTNNAGKLDNISVQPSEELNIGRKLTDKDKGGLIPAHGLFNNKDKEIYEKNLIAARDLLDKIGLVKDVRGAKKKLEEMGITGSKISSIITGLNYSGKSSYSTPEGKAMINILVPVLKKIFKVGVCSVLDRGPINEGLGGLRSMALAGLMGVSPIVGQPSVFASTSKPTTTISHESRGIKNNNPGNIVKSNTKWEGKTGDDGKFETFDTPENGIRALCKIIKTYNKKHNLNTISGIINRWAPPNENDTAEYIKFVSKKTGLNSDVVIDTNDKLVMVKLIKSIIEKENGKNPYADSVIQAGINKA